MKQLILFLLVFSSLSLFAQRGGRVSVIKKDRWVDFTLAKGNDTRTYIDDTDPENPVTIYPIFRFVQNGIGSIPIPSGVLDIRSSIIQSDSVLNTRTQRFNGSINAIGDNQQRNAYPAGLLELRLRLPRWQQAKLNSINFALEATLTNNLNYRTSYIDVSELNSVIGVETLTDSNSNNRLSYFNSENNPDLERLELPAFSQTELDISDNLDLRYLDVGTSYNNLQTFTISNDEYSNLTFLRLVDGSLASFPALDAPNLAQIYIYNNPAMGNIDVSGFSLVRLFAYNCGITSIDLTTQTGLYYLRFGSNGATNSNNISTNITGLYGLSNLRELYLSNAGISMTNFEIDNFPLLQTLNLSKTSGITGSIVSTTVNTNLTFLNVREGNQPFNPEHFPNLNTLLFNDDISSTGLSAIDLTYLTKLHSIYPGSCGTGGTFTVYDLSDNTVDIQIFYNPSNHTVEEIYFPPNRNIFTNSASIIRNCTALTKIVLPTGQFSNNVFGTSGIYDNPALSTIENINAIERTNTVLYINNLALSTLNTSFGGASCFPNLVGLAVGGTNDTYTGTAVYDERKNDLHTIIVLGEHFQISGNIGTDFGASAQRIHIIGDSNISYTTPGTFGATMSRVYLRPDTGGLTTDGNQVANLIIDLSVKNWTTETNAVVCGNNYAYKVIDLRGNCASPTPSTALTDALNLLTTKGVTVLTN